MITMTGNANLERAMKKKGSTPCPVCGRYGGYCGTLTIATPPDQVWCGNLINALKDRLKHARAGCKIMPYMDGL